MALASDEHVVTRLGRDLTDEESERVEGLLDEASVAVVGYLGYEPGEPVPDAVAIVVSRMVARALSSASSVDVGLTNIVRTVGPITLQRGYTPDATSGGVWLTRQDKTSLRPYARRGRAGNVLTSKW